MLHIDLQDIQNYSASQIMDGIIASSGMMTLDIGYTIIGSTEYSYEVAMEHLAVAFFLDRITRYSTINSVVRKKDGYSHYTRYTLEVKKEEKAFSSSLIHYGTWLIDGVLMHDVNNEFGKFEAGIDNYKANYTDEIEKAYANFVTRGIYELASESEEDEDKYLENHFFKQHPEWRYGYWKHHQKGIPDDSLFYSPYNWIIKSADRNIIFKAVYGRVTKFEECWVKDGIAFCKYGAVTTFIPNFHDAELMLLTINSNANSSQIRYLLSESNDVLIADYGIYSIVNFDITYAKQQAVEKCYSNLAKQSYYLSCLLGHSQATKVDWTTWTPEQFEDLCYDIILSQFAHKDVEIYRMGKTRSRDGGRDIVVREWLPFDSTPKKYIVQCKLITNGNSLSLGRMRSSITDVVIKSNANAYVIMTNELIDSTLHDLLDDLEKSKLEVDTSLRYDRNRIEHFLALHKEIRDKYIIAK